jgi:hypothetical protein
MSHSLKNILFGIKHSISDLPILVLQEYIGTETTNIDDIVQMMYDKIPELQNDKSDFRKIDDIICKSMGLNLYKTRSIANIMSLDINLINRYMMAFNIMYTSPDGIVTEQMAKLIYNTLNHDDNNDNTFDLFDHKSENFIYTVEQTIYYKNVKQSLFINVAFYNLDQTEIPYPEAILQESFLKSLNKKFITSTFDRLYGYKELNEDLIVPMIVSALKSFSKYGWTSGEKCDKSENEIDALDNLLSRASRISTNTNKFVKYIMEDGRGVNYTGNTNNYGKLSTIELSLLVSIDIKYLKDVEEINVENLIPMNKYIVEEIHEVDLLLESYIKTKDMSLFNNFDNLDIRKDKI